MPPLWRESRLPAERLALALDPVWRGDGVPHGNGEPVLLIAGLPRRRPSLGTMAALAQAPGLRAAARRAARERRLRRRAPADRLEERVRELHAADRAARRASSARAAAAASRGCSPTARPDAVAGHRDARLAADRRARRAPAGSTLHVRAVATLGTLGVPGPVLATLSATASAAPRSREPSAPPFPDGVGFVSVYSRSDGIVDWRACIDPAASNVQVDASHCGMSAHAGAYRVVARALAGFETAAPEPAVRRRPAKLPDRDCGAEQRRGTGHHGGRRRRAVRQLAAPRDRARDVREVARDRGGEPRPQRIAARRRGEATGVEQHLAHAERAQRHLGGRACRIGPQPAAREPLRARRSAPCRRRRAARAR